MILTLSLETGGDLPDNTTYYFTGWFGQGTGYYGGCWGKAAEEVSITTTAPNQQIKIEWGYMDGDSYVSGIPLEYMPPNYVELNARTGAFIKWDYYTMKDAEGNFYKRCNLNDPNITSEFQDSQGHRRWMNLYHPAGFTSDYVYATTSSLLDNQMGNFNHSELSWDYNRYPVIANIPWDKSDLMIFIEDGEFTERDLNDAIVNMDESYRDRLFLLNGWNLNAVGNRNIVLKGSISGTAPLSLNNVNLMLVSNTKNMNDAITYTDCVITDNQFTQYFWLNTRGSYFNTIYKHNGNSFILDNLYETDGFKPWCGAGTTNYGAIDGLSFENMTATQWRYFKPNMPITNSVFYNCLLNATPNSVDHDYTGDNAITWNNVRFDNEDAFDYDVEISYSYNLNEDAKDEINCYNVSVDRTEKKLKVRFLLPDYPNEPHCIFSFFQDVDLTIMQQDGTYLEGAEITIIDNQGIEYDGITDSDGFCGLEINTYRVELDPEATETNVPGGYRYYTKTTDYNEMSLFISKAGYRDYIMPISIEEKTELEISLVPTEPPLIITEVTVVDVTTYGANDGQITIVASGGTLPYTYSIDDVNYNSNNVFSGLTPGEYSCSVKDSSENVYTDPILAKITEEQLPPLKITEVIIIDTSSRVKSDGSITIIATGGTAPYEYKLNDSNYQTSNEFRNLPANNYTLYVKDSTGTVSSLGGIRINRPPIITGSIGRKVDRERYLQTPRVVVRGVQLKGSDDPTPINEIKVKVTP